MRSRSMASRIVARVSLPSGSPFFGALLLSTDAMSASRYESLELGVHLQMVALASGGLSVSESKNVEY